MCERTDDGKFTVTRAEQPDGVPYVQMDGDGFPCFACDIDFGFSLYDDYVRPSPLDKRVASRTVDDDGCSCQYPVAFGGLPCRHELACMLREGGGFGVLPWVPPADNQGRKRTGSGAWRSSRDAHVPLLP